MNWGKSIALTFVLFLIFIGTLVYVCIKQDLNLVAKDYYAQEINHENKMAMIGNYNRLMHKPELNIDQASQLITIVFPDSLSNYVDEGEVHFFRPSNHAMDRIHRLNLRNSEQVFEMDLLKRGFWRARLQWNDGDKEYFHEYIMNI